MRASGGMKPRPSQRSGAVGAESSGATPDAPAGSSGRSRSSIANFFNNGARTRGLVGNGADGLPSTPDDVLLLTGETLSQIQARVLGAASSSSLFTEVPGYVTFNVRGGFKVATGHELIVDVENITDRSYRGISWGVDASGIGVALRYVGSF